MTRTLFNTGWTVRPQVSIFAQLGGPVPSRPVTLPHDALISEERSPEHPGKNAYYPGTAAYQYETTLDVPEEYRGKRVWLEFERAYRDAVVFVNGDVAGQWRFGYSPFVVRLDDQLRYGSENRIRVDVRAHDDSRWYSGIGLLGDVTLGVADLVHIEPHTLRVTTPDIGDDVAAVEVAFSLANAETSTVTVDADVVIADPQGNEVARVRAPVTVRGGDRETVRLRMFVRDPLRWSVDDPTLYHAAVTIRSGEDVRDAAEARVGFRTLQLDPVHGLRVNGDAVLLRGTALHADNGLLGGAAPRAADRRRIELLKAAGFNAIRSAHNPVSTAILDACDELGVLVVDEAFEVWTVGKSSFDYSLDFAEWADRDLAAMVAKDMNHPSVIAYSIGNEIPETGTPLGSRWGRRLAERVRELDGSRFVTNAINGFVSVLPEVMAMRAQAASEAATGGVNDMMGSAGDMMNRISSSDTVSEKTAESFSVLDLGSINYGDARYAIDAELFPHRVLVGSESFPARIAVNWGLVESLPHVIGDFTWIGWDYLGEVGIGRIRYADEPPTFQPPYPWRTAWCGDLDIIGYRRSASYFRETVFGLRHEPYLAVGRPRHHGRALATDGGWAWPDSLASWTWSADTGSPITVEVYSDADEVELIVNGRSVGRAAAGRSVGFRTAFETLYEPGSVEAVAYVAGREHSRTALRTAGSARLRVMAERAVVGVADDLAFVAIELRDDEGILVTDADRSVSVTVQGSGELIGFGSGRPDTPEAMTTQTAETFDGRALAIVRPTAAGEITVTAVGDGLAAASARIVAEG